VAEFKTVQLGDVEVELRVDPSLAPSVMRAFCGTTALDAEVDALPLPQKPLWLRTFVRLLRWYRSAISPHLGQRCGFEPSCSRYSELAFRQFGFVRGAAATIDRLRRCRPGTGGVDLP
jgi:putative component of membrane protein insertase Oxa1/YidC/SpoIIIJ protein YidD